MTPPYVAAVDSHTDVWRAVINHGRIPDGENVVVTTKHGMLQGRRIVGDNRAGRRIVGDNRAGRLIGVFTIYSLFCCSVRLNVHASE